MQNCLAIDGCHITIRDYRKAQAKTLLGPRTNILNEAFVQKQIHKCILARNKREYRVDRAHLNLP